MNNGDALRRFAAATEHDLLHLATTAANNFGAELFRTLVEKGHSVRPAHVPVFAGLDPEGTNISALASRAGISRQAMSGLVRDVEAAGYVTTAADQSDRRALVVTLTEKGAAFCDDAIALSFALSSAWREKLGADRYDVVVEGLSQMGA